MKTVPLTGKRGAGLVALVDDHKLPLVLPYRWWLVDPTRSNTVYAWTQILEEHPCGECGQRRRRTIRMHNLITGWDYVDHEDGNGLNNQEYNLRKADQGLNEAAKHKTSRPTSSRFKGVCWDRNKGKWAAQIGVNGKNVNLGRYADEVEAAKAYDAAARAAFGGFARLNFPA